MIAYFDTSAVVPLLVDEIGSARSLAQWSAADRVVTARLTIVEARAALARARGQDRLTERDRRLAVTELVELLAEADLVDVDGELVEAAAALAEQHGLRAHDAVHLAAAATLADDDVVLVTGDHTLLDAATAVGLAVAAVA